MLPTVIVPGYLESAIAYRQLEQSLQQMGCPTVTVPLRRRDWLPTLGKTRYANFAATRPHCKAGITAIQRFCD